MNDFTAQELRLIRAVSPHWYSLVISDIDFCPPIVYRILCETAFINNLQGPHIEALRKACGAIDKCNPYRHTVEFNLLCEFDLPEPSESAQQEPL